MQILRAGVLYFLLIFGVGSVLGPIRILWVLPRLGTRLAEVFEAPIMLVIVFLAARWIVRRLAVPSAPWSRLSMGCFALGVLLLAEFSLVPWIRGLSIHEYLAGRDPVAENFHYSTVGVFAITPLFTTLR